MRWRSVLLSRWTHASLAGSTNWARGPPGSPSKPRNGFSKRQLRDASAIPLPTFPSSKSAQQAPKTAQEAPKSA
eukprot:7062876-Pyramimonas_sp.AAC.1